MSRMLIRLVLFSEMARSSKSGTIQRLSGCLFGGQIGLVESGNAFSGHVRKEYLWSKGGLMGQEIVKQSNGKFAVWSSIVDDFVMIDADPLRGAEIEKC